MPKAFYVVWCLWMLPWPGLGLSEGAAEAVKRFRLPELHGVVLDGTELPSFTLKLQTQGHWSIGQSPDGRDLPHFGVNQEFCDVQGRLLVISYARFRDSTEARRAAAYHTKVVAAVFRAGLWDGWQNRAIGDSSWVAVSRTQAALMVQKGTLCFLIGYLMEDREKAQRLVFSVAQKILAKEARRGEQEPAPEAQCQPIKKFRIPEVDGALLDETDVERFTLVNQSLFHWWKGQTSDGRGHEH